MNGGGAGADEAAAAGGVFCAVGVVASGGGSGSSFAGRAPLFLPMLDRSFGVGEGNNHPDVCWGQGFASIVLEVGVCTNTNWPGGETRKNLISEGVGGVRSFELLRLISALGGGVVGPFLEGGSIVGGVVTVGSAGTMAGEGVCSCSCAGVGGSVGCPLLGCVSCVSPCGPGAGSGLSRAAGEPITTSGRGGSGGAGRSGTGGRSPDRVLWRQNWV